jgi:hypothetical protein
MAEPLDRASQVHTKNILTRDHLEATAEKISLTLLPEERFQSVVDLFSVSVGSNAPLMLQLARYGYQWHREPPNHDYFDPSYMHLMYEVMAQNVKLSSSDEKTHIGKMMENIHKAESMGAMMRIARDEPVKYWFNAKHEDDPQAYTIGLIASLRIFGSRYGEKEKENCMENLQPLTQKLTTEHMTLETFFDATATLEKTLGRVPVLRAVCAYFDLYEGQTTFGMSDQYQALRANSASIAEKLFQKTESS